MYKITQDLTVKVNGSIKTFHAGSVVKLSEKLAQMFIQQDKIEPVFEPEDNLAERMCIQGENTEPDQTMPYVTSFGSLVIPFNCPLKYRYWQGGQSVCDTLRELGRCDLILKYKSFYSN